MRLFVELYLDEDVSVLVAKLLQARGFVTLTTLEAGNLGATDEQQLEYATSRQMTLLTHNRKDFEQLSQQWYETGRDHHGIIIAVKRAPHEIVAKLVPILNQRTWDEMRNQVLYT